MDSKLKTAAQLALWEITASGPCDLAQVADRILFDAAGVTTKQEAECLAESAITSLRARGLVEVCDYFPTIYEATEAGTVLSWEGGEVA